MRQDILLIIPCSKKKIWDKMPILRDVPAKYAYTSTYFRLCRSLAERMNVPWFILSAKYGLIPPEYIIPNNYDVSFKANPGKSADLQLIIRQMKNHKIYKFEKIYSLCGNHYNKILNNALCTFDRTLDILFPADMKSIGKRQKWMKHLCENPNYFDLK